MATPHPPQINPLPLSSAPLQVPLGPTLADAAELPTLPARHTSVAGAGPRHSVLGPGVDFHGVARLNGSLTIAGSWRGQVLPPNTPEATGGRITITETGELLGRVVAQEVAVLGRVTGEIDASGGRVTLHSGAQVSGQVRYTQLQTHGAEIDARLEYVPATALRR